MHCTSTALTVLAAVSVGLTRFRAGANTAVFDFGGLTEGIQAEALSRTRAAKLYAAALQHFAGDYLDTIAADDTRALLSALEAAGTSLPEGQGTLAADDIRRFNALGINAAAGGQMAAWVVEGDLRHENPTLLLTNQMKTSAGQLIDRYARRMVIENAIADAIAFFHMDAPSAAVPMKVDLDLQLTLMANTLYRLLAVRLLAVRLGNGRQVSRARTLFRDFIKAAAEIHVGDNHDIVRIGRRANNPFLLNAGYGDLETTVPWLQNRTLKIEFV